MGVDTDTDSEVVTRVMFTQLASLDGATANSGSVRLSVRPSITLVIHA